MKMMARHHQDGGVAAAAENKKAYMCVCVLTKCCCILAVAHFQYSKIHTDDSSDTPSGGDDYFSDTLSFDTVWH